MDERQLEFGDPVWMYVARQELGVHETAGGGDTARVQEYFGATTMGPHTHDAVPWCSAFVNWCMTRAGFAGTRSAGARSWLQWGVPLLRPRQGCIIVFSRPLGGPDSGHVGFLAELPNTHDLGGAQLYQVLGGNQHDSVSIAAYPASRVLGWRWVEET